MLPRLPVRFAAPVLIAICSFTHAAANPNPGNDAPTGYYSTSGNLIVDSAGNPVKLNGINWFGFETPNYVLHGLWQRNMGAYLDQMDNLGYNLIRLPFSNELLDPGRQANSINYYENPELQGLSAIQVFDRFIEEAGKRGMKVILDRHRPTGASQSELWYTSQVTEQRWINDWVALANRYKDNPTVIGADLHNEPHGPATWGTGNTATDWRLAAERAGNAILDVNPNWLIVVEGVETYQGQSSWWGGNLKGVANHPVRLNVDNKLVYSPHDYGPGVFPQTWFNDPDFPNNLEEDVWDPNWGYIHKQGIAPILVGEFGGKNVDTTSKEGIWQNKLVDYIRDNNMYWTYWSWNPNSGDTGGVLNDDWTTINQAKQAMLNRLINNAAPNPNPQQPGATIAKARFDDNATGQLHGQGGGEGWEGDGNWNVNIDRGKVNVVRPDRPLSYRTPDGAVVHGGEQALEVRDAMYNTNLLSRDLAHEENGDDIYISFLYRNDGGSIDTGDALLFWFGNADGPNIGINGNGDGAKDFFVRTDKNSVGQWAGEITPGNDHFVVGRLYKSVMGEDKPYDRLALWVDPAYGQFAAPHATAALGANAAHALTSFQRFGLKAWNMDDGDRNLFDEITLGRVWNVPTLIAAAGFDDNIPGQINTQAGGLGFGSAGWTLGVDTSKVNVVTPSRPLSYAVSGGGPIAGGSHALEFRNAMYQGGNYLRRDLGAEESGDNVFISFLFRNEAGVINTDDSLVLWLGDVGGPVIGIKGNGDGEDDFFVRLSSDSAGAWSTDITQGEDYFIVGHLFKSTGGEGALYDRFALWVNPDMDDLGAPDATALLGDTSANGIASFLTLGFRGFGMDDGDVNLFDQITLGRTWYDVVPASAPVPEPASAAILAGVVALLARWRTRD